MKKIILLLLLIPIQVYAIETSAKSAILMDMNSKRILYAKNIHEVRSVASISKIMTAVIAIESGRLDDIVLIGDEINNSYGSGIYITKGEEISLRDLVYGLLLRSGNDASLAIENYLGKDKFVSMMNDKAREIGMLNTTFNNPNGLDDIKGNYSTAYDMALLTSYAMSLPEYRIITSTKYYSLKTNKNSYYWINKNKLLFSYEYITGGKTGYTDKARRTLVSTANKDDLELVVVTMDDKKDFNDHVSLFKYGFDNYEMVNVLKKGILELSDNLYYNVYDLYIPSSFSYPIKQGEQLSIEYLLSNNPHEGNIGKSNVYLDGNKIYFDDIIAKKIKK